MKKTLKGRRTFAEILSEIVERSRRVPDPEVIGFIKGAILNVPGLAEEDREALFSLATRAGDGIKLSPRGEVNVNVRNIQNANSSATASPQVSQTVNVAPAVDASSVEKGVAQKRSQDPASTVADTREVDGMTGLLRREVLESELPQRLAEAHESGQPLSVIMLDIDKFKAVNDTHGHAKGDEVLKKVGQLVKTMTAGKGTAYRYGGEEITIVLPNHDVDEAGAVAERLRRTVQAEKPADLDLTASFGVACSTVHGSTVADLQAKADRALYQAKNDGRNLVRIAVAD